MVTNFTKINFEGIAGSPISAYMDNLYDISVMAYKGNGDVESVIKFIPIDHYEKYYLPSNINISKYPINYIAVEAHRNLAKVINSDYIFYPCVISSDTKPNITTVAESLAKNKSMLNVILDIPVYPALSNLSNDYTIRKKRLPRKYRNDKVLSIERERYNYLHNTLNDVKNLKLISIDDPYDMDEMARHIRYLITTVLYSDETKSNGEYFEII